MTNNMDKERLEELYRSICATLRPVALRKAEEICEGCGCKGVGKIEIVDFTNHTHRSVEDCPTCTPKRDLMLAWAEKLCRHEWNDIFYPGWCGKHNHIYECQVCHARRCACHSEMPTHPIFSIEPIDGHLSLVQFMKDAGEWEGFVEWHTDEIETVCYSGKSDDCYCHGSSAEILTTTELLAQAINSYFTREER